MRLIMNAAMYCQVSDISRLSEDELRAEVDTKLGEIVNPLRYRQQSELQAGRLHVLERTCNSSVLPIVNVKVAIM